MRGPARRPLLRWSVVVAIALAAWLTPLLVVWLNAHEARRQLRRPAAQDDAAGPQDGPLILFADTWPTRRVVNIEEIQGQSAESDVALGAQVVAKDLARALSQLGVTGEVRRMDAGADPKDLLGHREIVLVYPARHGAPPWQVAELIDHDLEALVASQDPRLSGLRLRDVAIAEEAAPAAAAQASIAATMAYYHLSYRPGPALVEAMNSLVIYRRLQALAEELTIPSATHE
jgi:hypothetical protein